MSSASFRSFAFPVLWQRFGVWVAATLIVVLVFLFLAALQTAKVEAPEPVEVALIEFVGLQQPEEEVRESQQRSEPMMSLPKKDILDTPDLDIDPLELSMTIRPQDLVAKRFEFEGFGTLNSIDGLRGFATVADVDEKPRPIKPLGALFPESLIFQGIYSGEVSLVVVVDKQGFVEVRKVLGSSHPDLESVVIDVYNKAIYAVPTKNGRPTDVVMKVDVRIDADPGRVRLLMGSE